MIKLLIPYAEKDEVKKLVKGLKFDPEFKYWIYPNAPLPKELEPYQMRKVDVPFKYKGVFKENVKSLHWDASQKSWYIAERDKDLFFKVNDTLDEKVM